MFLSIKVSRRESVKKLQTTIIILSITLLASCYPTRQLYWEHPTKSEYEFRIDQSECQNQAYRVIREPVDQVAPYGANAYAQIGVANLNFQARLEYKRNIEKYVDNCLYSKGWFLR
jgi:hypothetical protein